MNLGKIVYNIFKENLLKEKYSFKELNGMIKSLENELARCTDKEKKKKLKNALKQLNALIKYY